MHLGKQIQVILLRLVHFLCQGLDFRFREVTEKLLLEQMALVQFEIHNYLLINLPQGIINKNWNASNGKAHILYKHILNDQIHFVNI